MTEKTQTQLFADGIIRLNREGRLCTYCMLQIINPTIARECPYHLPITTETPTEPTAQEKRGRAHNGRPKGLIPHCPRCRAPHRHSLKSRNNRCIDCEFEEEWDE